MDGVLLVCRGCGTEFRVCQSCWRGQRYCGKECSRHARTESKRKNQKKYSKTPQGRKLHKLKQKRYRKIHDRQKNSETDHTTALPKTPLKRIHSLASCLHCGARVERVITPLGFYSFRRNDQHAHP